MGQGIAVNILTVHAKADASSPYNSCPDRVIRPLHCANADSLFFINDSGIIVLVCIRFRSQIVWVMRRAFTEIYGILGGRARLGGGSGGWLSLAGRKQAQLDQRRCSRREKRAGTMKVGERE